ncbi:type I restriction enzyme S subunit [Arthrobacter bambusae]|uniref:Type I restriction enzyme S subunit n=1 Tax=Arthrobacter bambusae TaxID=1338426 RepID=A0ABV2P8H6_9MICC
MTIVAVESHSDITQATLPDGWAWATLQEVCTLISDGTHQTPKYVSVGVPFYSVENVMANNFTSTKFVSESAHQEMCTKRGLQRGDILMTRIGSLGITKLINWDVRASFYVSLALLRPGREIESSYLYAYTQSSNFIRTVEDRSLLWAVPKKINMGDIGQVPIAYPVDPAEQVRIAEAINDAEMLVWAIEKMIAKKLAIKRGIMQQLLTGRSRLPGYRRPWRSVKLGDHVKYVKTVALSRAQLDGASPIRYLHYGDIHTSSAVLLPAATQDMPRAPKKLLGNAGLLQVGDLVFADASEDPAGIGKSVEITSVPMTGVVPGLHTIAARFDKAILADGFKAYLQFVPNFRNALLRLAAGTKVLATTRAYISGMTLVLPEVDEQLAIARVIADSDYEIEALQRRLTKAKSIKQGLMQELLTGNSRLPFAGVGA